MRPSLFILLGLFAAIVCFEKPAVAEQNYPWCAYYDLGQAAFGAAGSRHCSNAWTMCAVSAGTVDPVRIQPRRDRIRRPGFRNTIITTIGLGRPLNNRPGPGKARAAARLDRTRSDRARQARRQDRRRAICPRRHERASRPSSAPDVAEKNAPRR